MAKFKRGNLDLKNNEKIRLGDSLESQINFDGSTLTFEVSGDFIPSASGDFIAFASNEMLLYSGAYTSISVAGVEVTLLYNNDQIFGATGGGSSFIRTGQDSVRLYHAGTKTLETTASGINVFDTTEHTTLKQDGPNFEIDNNEIAGFITIKGTTASDTPSTMVNLIPDGAVELYYNTFKIFETTGRGISISDELGIDPVGIEFYDNDLRITKQNTAGHLYIEGGKFGVGTQTMLRAVPSGSAELYYDGTKVFETDAVGIVTSKISAAVGSDNYISFNEGADRIQFFTNGNELLQLDNIFTVLHNDGTKAIETASAYIDFYGATGTRRLQIHPGDTESRIRNTTNSTTMALQSFNAASALTTMGLFDPDGAVELYYDGTKVFETYQPSSTQFGALLGDLTTVGTSAEHYSEIYQVTSNGGLIFDNNFHNGYIQFVGQDAGGAQTNFLQLKHTGTSLFQANEPVLVMSGDGFWIKNGGDNQGWKHQIAAGPTYDYYIQGEVTGGGSSIILRSYSLGTTTWINMVDADPDLGVKLENGVRVNEISNDTTLTDASPSALVTEYAVKTFVLAASAARDEHNELKSIQGGIPSASEYYHLSESIHDGLFSASPTIGMGASASTRLEVDYGNDTITANSSGTGLISFDSNEFTVGYGGFPHLTVTEDDTYLGRTNTDYVRVDDSGNSVSIYSINTLAANFTNNAQIIGRNTEASMYIIQGGQDEIRGVIGNANRLIVNDTSFSIGASATGKIEVRDNAIQIHDNNLLTAEFKDTSVSLYTSGAKVFETTANGFTVTTSGGTNVAVFSDDGCDLYYAGSKTLDTVAGGLSITDGLSVAQFYQSSGVLYCDNDQATGNILFRATNGAAAKHTYLSVHATNSTASLHAGGTTVLTTINDGSNYGVQITAGGSLGGSIVTNPATDVLWLRNHELGAAVSISSRNVGDTADNLLFNADPDGAAELYYAGNKVAETTANGFTVTTSAGANIAVFDDVSARLYYDGSKYFETINTGTAGGIKVQAGSTGYINLLTNSDGSTVQFAVGGSPAVASFNFLSAEAFMVANYNGSVDLYYDNVKTFETTSTGAAVTGDLEYLNISTVTSATTASNSDVILASGGPYTVSLEEKDRAIIRVKYIDSGSTITVQGLSGTIDGAANTTLTSQYESITVVSDGSNWYIV